MASVEAARVEHREELALRSGEDVVRLRQAVRERAVAAGFSLVDQTKIVTAASELGRNTVQHGRGGQASIALVVNGSRRGVRLEFVDHGPGIPDVALAMKDGYTTGSGLGLGLSGAKRLSDEFEIDSAPGKGTRVAIVRWKAY
jgi:serine/threonine-protein kinase RsbT